MTMKRSIAGLCAAACAAIPLMGQAAADELYRQDPINSFGGLSSQDARNPGGLGWFSEVADDFPAEAGWSIGAVDFWGGYASPLGEEGNTEGFTIRVYTDNSGSPGTRIFEQDVFEFTREAYHVGSNGLAGYEYTLELDPPFVASDTEQLWISVVAILARGGGVTEPQWGWIRSATTTTPFAHQWFFDPGNFQPQNQDVAFVLRTGGDDPCPPDWNGDGVVDSDDLFDFLSDWAAGNADYNGDGVTDSDDLFDFLSDWAVGC